MPEQAQGDEGFSLVELIVTIAIMAACVVALVTGVATSISSSRGENVQASANAVLRDYEQGIESQVWNSSVCSGTGGSFVTAISPALPSGYTLQPAVGTPETCPLSDKKPVALSIKVTSTGGASDSTTVWLWLP